MYNVIRHGWRGGAAAARAQVGGPTTDDLTVLQFKCRIHFIWRPGAMCRRDYVVGFFNLDKISFLYHGLSFVKRLLFGH